MKKEDVIGKCILCHRDGQIMSDEHVIPDAIGGHYHIYSICRDCNSKLGYAVDKHLLNNWLTICKRYEHHLAGKSTVPHPLLGEGTMEDGQKVRVEIDKEGNLYPHLIPSAPIVSDDNKQISFSVDSRDEKSASGISNSILKRKGIDSSKYKIESHRRVEQIEHSLVKMQHAIDIKSYILSLLKIAYEFTVDKCPEYVNDPMSLLYADILLSGDVNRVDEIKVMANHFLSRDFSILEDYIDNNDKRHILFLTEIGGKLTCFIKLFDVFEILIQMSDKTYGFDILNGVVAINDFEKRNCVFYKVSEILSKTVQEESRQYILDREGENVLSETQAKAKESEFGFACNKYNQNIAYNADGIPIMTEDQLLYEVKIFSKTIYNKIESGFEEIFNFPNGIYYCVKPADKLVEIKGVKIITKIQKI